MNKTCARCEKTVYPTEELKCLDKVWHKGCFKCQECGMTLNMRTYKGYGKLPYCEAHVPKAKHTTMAETPELKRIAENTKLQSNVKYHADFEKSKGKFTQVADDPETLRIKANTKIISNVAYHGDLEKKAQMEKQRQINENGELVEVPSTDNYHQQIENYATEMLTTAPNLPPKNHYQAPQHQGGQSQSQAQSQGHTQNQRQYKPDPPRQENYRSEQYRPEYSQEYYRQQQHQQQHQQHHQQQQQNLHQQQQQALHQQQQQTLHQQQQQQNLQQQQQQNLQQQQTLQQQKYDDYYSQYPKYDEYNQNQYTYGQYTQPNYGVGGQQKIGRIQDYDPLSDGPRAAPNTQRASSTLIYNSTNHGANDVKQRGSHHSVPHQQQQSRQIGRVTDLDPLANEQPPPPAPYQNQNQVNQRVYVAMYDYEANDSDEVSFREGDYISNVSCIDEGWMTGQVLRTGRTGMLPANYVQLATNQHH